MAKALTRDQKIFEVEPSEIAVGEERIRKDFNVPEMEKLKSSIAKLGQLHPIVLADDGLLISGERRLRACTELGIKVLAIYKKDIKDDLLRKEAELEENLMRSNLTPQEETIGRHEIHQIKKTRADAEGFERSTLSGTHGWGLEDTAKEIGISKSELSRDVEVGGLLALGISSPEIEKAKTKRELRSAIEKLKKKLEWDKKAEEAQSRAEDSKGFVMTPGEFKNEKLKKALKGLHQEEFCADALDGIPAAHIVIFDPPWGVGLDEKLAGTTGEACYDDSSEGFTKNFPLWARVIYDAMAPDSHLYCFFGIVHHEFVYATLEKAGFVVNRRPLVWVKPGVKSTRVPNLWPGASYEPIAFARKGQRDLVKKAGDAITISALTPTEKNHPSEKPTQLFQELLLRSAYPGDVILDPMFGAGGVFRACENLPELSLSYYGCEKDPGYFSYAVAKLSDIFA